MAVNFKVPIMSSKSISFVQLLVLLYFQCAQTAKLTVPRILLPYNTGIPTNYTLEVKEGACYKWSSNRHDLVSVTAIPSDREPASCTTKALVTALSRYPERKNAIILAEDEKSGQILRCDVVIDSLQSIEIITTTRVLFLEDAPEAFEVVAKNDQGDTFSSLAGVAFQWSLESDSPASDAYGVLRFLRFADSIYKTPSTVGYWEKQNLHGSMILMEGSKTGSAKVTVKPLESAYKHVSSYDVSLVVVANLNLKPAHIYVLPGTKITYQLELIKQGKAFPISLPSDQYYLELANKSVATLDDSVSVVSALQYGTTNIVVKDRYISGREVAYLPSAVIHVTQPSFLTFSVSSVDQKWSLEEQKDYSISVSIFDRNSHPIFLSEDVRVAVSFPKKFFQIEKHSINGTYQEIQTLYPGSCVITANLLGIANADGSITEVEPISGTQEVTIYKSIKVHPAITLLPWDPVSKPQYSISLKASGGTGAFNWMSGDTTLASVHAVYEQEETTARVSTFGLGTFKVHAVDAHIPAFKGFGQVSIQPVIDLEIIPDEVEVELNATLILPVAMYGYLPDKTPKMFSNCSEVSMAIEIDETQKFIHLNDTTAPVKATACRNIILKCVNKGFNRMFAKYKLEDISLKKFILLACYTKLKVVHPSNEVVIAIGSSLDVHFEGGPSPWPKCPTNFINSVAPEEEFVEVSSVKNETDISDVHKLNAFCMGYGENTFTLTVGNHPCETNPHPIINQASVGIFCSVPESITLKPILPTIEGKKCPTTRENRIAIHSAESLDLQLIVKDNNGREFHNISSFDINWYLSEASLAQFSSYEGAKVKMVKRNAQQRAMYFQQLHPYGTEGILKVTASILGYKPNLPKVHENIYDESFTVINSSLNFILVEEAEVEPKTLSVFNSPSSKVFFNVSKGSGYFQVEASDPTKVEVVYKSATRQIEVVPLDTGFVTLTVTDLCLGIIHRSVAEIQIYGISAVVVDVLDKVQLGNSITASVEVLNEDKQKIPASVFSLMNLEASSLSEIISVRLASQPEPHQFQALYTINGLSLGQTSFKIITKANIFKGIQYSSDTYPIQVFSPLKLNPHHVVLVVGATFQVLCSGGPQPQTNIEYLIDNKDIAVVTGPGIVEAKKIGKTTLTARSVGLDKNGNTVVFSEDKTMVTTISLKEIKIHSPLSRMVAGTEMPLHAMGLTEQENPFAFGTTSPSAEFRWSVSNDKVASLYSIYNNVGLQESPENNFRVGIKAHQDGLVTVNLEVTLLKQSSLTFFGGSQVLSSEIQIQVFKRLKLTNPDVEDGMIIMSPNSQLKLKCNRFGAAKVSLKIMPHDIRVNHPVVSIDESGSLIAGSKMGSTVLLVTAVEEFGITQRLSVIIKVEEIAYLMLKPVGKIMTKDWPLTVLPVGFSIPFAVTYHNNIGQVFDAVRSQLQYRASRHNSARVSFGSANSSLTVQVVKPGFTVLKVWDVDLPIPADYIKIATGIAIDPANVKLIVGDVVCFGSPLVTQEGHSGTWSTSKNVLSIHPVSGGAVAVTPGQTVVVYSLLNGFSTSTQVTVQDAAYISIESGNVIQISNLPRSKPYRIYLVVQSNETHRVNNVVGKNCSSATETSMPLPSIQFPFACELNFISSSSDISVNDLFRSESSFDIEKGMYYCSIEPVNQISISEVSTLEGQVSLSVHLLSMGHSSLLAQQLSFPFLPAFHVHQEELVLSDVQNSGQIIISATPAVQRCLITVPSDHTVLKVNPPAMSPVFPASVSFLVELHDMNYLWKGELSPLHVEISCPITKQQARIPIKVKRLEVPLESGLYCLPQALPPAADILYDWYFTLKVAAAALTVLVVFYIIRWLTSARRGMVTTQPVFLSSTAQSPHSFSPVQFTPSPFRQRFSPSRTEYDDNLSQPLRMCSLETSPQTLQRRRMANVFK